MIFVGIDDTDLIDTPGTNQLGKALIARLAGRYRPVLLLRHQLLEDPRVPCTSKNGSASILFEPACDQPLADLSAELRQAVVEWCPPGSDPGLCLTAEVPEAVARFGRRCQRELVEQAEARAVAASHDIYLEGLGGTEGGVIGALAAVGLAADGDDGRVVQLGTWPDDLAGPQDVSRVEARGIEVRRHDTGARVHAGRVDVGKHLRPNRRKGCVILFVVASLDAAADWTAVRLT